MVQTTQKAQLYIEGCELGGLRGVCCENQPWGLTAYIPCAKLTLYFQGLSLCQEKSFSLEIL